jgi:Zn-dependent peptidase ImmA (M78 family)
MTTPLMETEHTGNPEHDAFLLLNTVWARHEPDDLIPVDPVYIAEALGINVFVADLEHDVSGMLMKAPGEDAVIYLKRGHSRNRQRFTCAHELGHYVRATDNGNPETLSIVEHRSLLAQAGTDTEEIYANKFAAALLMPAHIVRARWAAVAQPASLAAEFGVSTDAMNYRLINLGLKRP